MYMVHADIQMNEPLLVKATLWMHSLSKHQAIHRNTR